MCLSSPGRTEAILTSYLLKLGSTLQLNWTLDRWGVVSIEPCTQRLSVSQSARRNVDFRWHSITYSNERWLQYKTSSYCTHLSSPSVCACRSLLPASLPYLGGPHHITRNRYLFASDCTPNDWFGFVVIGQQHTQLLVRTDKPSSENTTGKVWQCWTGRRPGRAFV